MIKTRENISTITAAARTAASAFEMQELTEMAQFDTAIADYPLQPTVSPISTIAPSKAPAVIQPKPVVTTTQPEQAMPGDQWFPIILSIPTPGETTVAQQQQTEKQRSERALAIGGVVLLVMIVIIGFVSIKK